MSFFFLSQLKSLIKSKNPQNTLSTIKIDAMKFEVDLWSSDFETRATRFEIQG